MKTKYSLQGRFIFLLLLILSSVSMTAQNIATFVDKSGRFKVFDNGEIQDLEHEGTDVGEVKIGGDYVVYKDNIGKLKRYIDGEVTHITDDQRVSAYAAQYLMAMVEGANREILKVNYGEEEELLTIDFDETRFNLQDSVLVFIDNFGYLSIFYDGETHEVSGRASDGNGFKASLNSVVYVDVADAFHLFYRGETTEVYHRRPSVHSLSGVVSTGLKPIEKDPEKSYSSRPGNFEDKLAEMTPLSTDQFKGTRIQPAYGVFGASGARMTLSAYRDDFATDIQCHVGDNFVVFIDEMDRLMVYDGGELTRLTDFVPKDYRGGDKMVAYVNPDNQFMVYWNGKAKELSPRPPKFQTVKNNTLAYVDDLGYFNVWDKGKAVKLEAYQPGRVAVFDGIVVYTDLDNRLKAYYEGKTMKISSEIIDNFQLVGRVILYSINNNKIKIFHDGKHYSG